MEETKKRLEVIDLRVVAQKIWKQKKLFCWTLPIAFVLSCIYILSIPRTYTSETTLAPEMENAMGGGTLGSIAASFGFDLSEMQTSDAISPLLYPDLMEDNKFIVGLFDIRVKSIDGEINATYHDYLKKHQKKAWWKYPIDWLKSLLPKASEPVSGGVKGGEKSPYMLSKDENAIAEKVREDVSISLNKKTGIISIEVKAQDPLICKTMADSVMACLQDFITDYRTNKARIDVEHYRELTAEAKKEYEKARQLYGSYADANMDIVLESFRAKRDDLENDMQLKFNTYTTISAQLQASMAKLQERTPAFTVVKGAAVPVKASGPKRMIFVAGMLILTFFGTIFYILKDDILAPFFKKD